MAPVNNNTMEHFTHPGHQLVKLQSNTEFLCDGCKTLGTGTKYRCHLCDFDLHEYCATCPRVLSTFMDMHVLSLVQRSSQAMRLNERTCNVCRDNVEGLFYRCKGCEFDVHPICTQLPKQVRHNYHPLHPLTLQAALTGWYCGVCGGACGTSLRYRCGPCNFDIHPQCIAILGPKTATKATTPQFVPPTHTNSIPPYVPTPAFGTPPPPFGSTTTPPPPPPYGAFPYGAPGVGSSSGNSNNMYNYMNQDPNNVYNYMNHDPNNVYNYMNQVQAGGAPDVTDNRKSRYAVLGKLALGTLSNMTFGSDFTSFM